jgi:isopentenyl-diphosphate delta-isomerase
MRVFVMPYDNPHELFALVDENDQVLGSIPRDEAHSDPTKIHRAVYVLITNSHNQMLFQKRSVAKDLYPSMWALACAGHVRFGQEYRVAAEREVFEELGLHPHLYYVTNVMVITEYESEHCQIYMCKSEVTPTNIDKTEIAEITWVNIPDISTFVAEHPLPPADMIVLRKLMYIA